MFNWWWFQQNTTVVNNCTKIWSTTMSRKVLMHAWIKYDTSASRERFLSNKKK